MATALRVFSLLAAVAVLAEAQKAVPVTCDTLNEQQCDKTWVEAGCDIDPCALVRCAGGYTCRSNPCLGCQSDAVCCPVEPVEANPLIPFYGYGSIVVSPNPVVVDEPTAIDLTFGNSGASAASAVEFTVSKNDWGVTFGGWQEIFRGSIDLSVGPGATNSYSLSHVFASRAHTCVEVKIGEVGDGGNSNLADDRGQINLEVVHVGNEATFGVPIANKGDEDIVVQNVEPKCVAMKRGSSDHIGAYNFVVEIEGISRRSGEIVQCPGTVTLNVPGLRDDGTLVLPAGAETVALLSVAFDPAEEGQMLRVVVEAQDQATGERNHVLVSFSQTSVPELLNLPHLCCIESIKTRVLLETMLAEALEAYEDGAYDKAVKLLRLFIQKAILLECDLSPAEKACLERAMAIVTDAARLALEALRSQLQALLDAGQAPSEGSFCGGVAGIQCRDALTCADGYTLSGELSGCHPDCGGSDCGGVCVEVDAVQPVCGGLLGLGCRGGYACFDAPDGCSALCGGADCAGQCAKVVPAPEAPLARRAERTRGVEGSFSQDTLSAALAQASAQLSQGDFFRRAGLPEAATYAYGKRLGLISRQLLRETVRLPPQL
mmetsp:Transcript_40343/g.95866  ORF Transcript_40343/g.95866 Transcript_40343/m.95866 type:complete len:603 (-) Transcript_40343:366-2174(-)